jgi:hypothetical protein
MTKNNIKTQSAMKKQFIKSLCEHNHLSIRLSLVYKIVKVSLSQIAKNKMMKWRKRH